MTSTRYPAQNVNSNAPWLQLARSRLAKARRSPGERVKTVDRAPLLFQLATRLGKAHIRGGTRLMNTLASCGMLDVVVDYKLGSHRLGVPIWRNPYDHNYILQWETELMELFCSKLVHLKNLVLFDCGADIGIFSSIVCSRSRSVSKVIAFEPNSEGFAFLRRNMAMLPVQAEAVPLAVSDFVGRGTLQSPDYDENHSARFLVPGDGEIDVTTIDAFGVRGGAVALKIDVEGGELEVLRGAVETIKTSENCVITIEAHPIVKQRNGRDPVECLRLLESIRPFSFTISETGARLSTGEVVIQPGQDEVRNIVCATH
jgi:FkbM family methyltransferase